jgi:hypothetical protein
MFSCNRNKNNEIENENEFKENLGITLSYIDNEENHKNNIENSQISLDNIQLDYTIDKRHLSSNEFSTNILENNVDVRIYPSLDADIIYQLHENYIVEMQGFSNNEEWVSIFYLGNREFIHGWVSAKYVNIGDIRVAPIKFIEQEGNRIVLSYEFEGENIYVEYIDWDKNNFIVWGIHQKSYFYNNVPGIYILDRNSNELKHITYFGVFNIVGWTRFMGDFEYLVQDYGTGPGIRGLTAWRLRDNKKMFNGAYYKNYFINNYTIQYIYVYDEWGINRGFLDEEIIAFGKAFSENNSIPPFIEEGINKGYFATIIIKCTLNLETGERKIINAEYILTP